MRPAPVMLLLGSFATSALAAEAAEIHDPTFHFGIETENSTTKQTTMTTYRLYNYKTGHLYSDHPTLEGALLSAMFHVEKGQKVKWSGGPHVWFGHVDRQAIPKFGVDVVKSETE